jgi:choline dehydrogenase-like flavoprotein
MSIADDHYDLIIIGTGAGGGTLAYQLAPTGKKILILERGGFLPREKANWNAAEVYQKERYHTEEVWYDKGGQAFGLWRSTFTDAGAGFQSGYSSRWDFSSVAP